jgi:hypothetical protein
MFKEKFIKEKKWQENEKQFDSRKFTACKKMF